MKIYIVIPVYNEEDLLPGMLSSIVAQTVRPDLVMIVNDNSTDGTAQIIEEYTSKYDFIRSLFRNSEGSHQPGSKIINAFYDGFDNLPKDFDLIGKFDADLILPSSYFEKTKDIFLKNDRVGIAGGNLYIKNHASWVFENISKKTKVRGPIKLYRSSCFQDIGGLKKSIGWDTVDELLAQYHSWVVATDETLHVQHLKPTGANYSKDSRLKQGQAFKRMRYGFCLTVIAAMKLAAKKRSFSYFWNSMRGYFSSKNEYIVSIEEGRFIRNLRWKHIKSKFF
jgi:glycosyltransferase involved in cell wall biosynthesis